MNQATTTPTLDLSAIERAYTHESHDECEGWLGFGYLGERRFRQDAIVTGEIDEPVEVAVANIARSDQAVLDYANSHGWTEHRLFEWLNSRDGRHFADQSLWGQAGIDRAIEWRLLPGVLGQSFSR